MPTKYAIQIAYEGTDFCGWQWQKGTGKHANPKPSVERLVAETIAKAFQEEVTVVASGRTDAGVHASGQVAHFTLNSPIPESEHSLDALNYLLDDSIRILRLTKVSESFSARSAIEKQYSYYIQQGPADLPHLRRFSLWQRRSLDSGRMQEAAPFLLGDHDFAVLGSQNAEVSSTVRTLSEMELIELPIPEPGVFAPDQQRLLRLKIRGTGFLKQMMRRIAGTLLLIGEGRQEPESIRDLLATQDRSLVGPTAPACGLWLDRVWYQKGSWFPFEDQDNERELPPFAT